MIQKFISWLAGIEKNDHEVDRIHAKSDRKIREATLVIKRAGKLQEILVRKTVTFYIGKAVGVIR